MECPSRDLSGHPVLVGIKKGNGFVSLNFAWKYASSTCAHWCWKPEKAGEVTGRCWFVVGKEDDMLLASLRWPGCVNHGPGHMLVRAYFPVGTGAWRELYAWILEGARKNGHRKGYTEERTDVVKVTILSKNENAKQGWKSRWTRSLLLEGHSKPAVEV